MRPGVSSLRYLIKTFNDTILKLFKYVPVFDEKGRTNFARTLGLIMADPQQQIVNPSVLQGLLADHVVKDGMRCVLIPRGVWVSLCAMDAMHLLVRPLHFLCRYYARIDLSWHSNSHVHASSNVPMYLRYRRRVAELHDGHVQGVARALLHRGLRHHHAQVRR